MVFDLTPLVTLLWCESEIKDSDTTRSARGNQHRLFSRRKTICNFNFPCTQTS